MVEFSKIVNGIISLACLKVDEVWKFVVQGVQSFMILVLNHFTLEIKQTLYLYRFLQILTRGAMCIHTAEE